MTKATIYETITNKIIAQLEAIEGNPQWNKPWFNIGVAPYNAISKKAYRGINHIVLGSNEYTCQAYATFKQWSEKDCKVRKGEKGHHVVLWKFNENENTETGEKSTSVYTTSYCVFNVNQVEGDYARELESKPLRSLNTHEAIDHAEQFITSYCKNELLKVKHDDRAYYSHGISGEHIGMPMLGQFKSPVEYYSTFIHEIGHSTGNAKRLNRDMTGGFGSKSYAFEELVAELTAAMLCGELGITNAPREDHAHYLKSWLRALKDDKKLIFSAASKAQRACDYINAAVENYQASPVFKPSVDTVTIAPVPVIEQPVIAAQDDHPLILAQRERMARDDQYYKRLGMIKRAGMYLWPTKNIKPNSPVKYAPACPKDIENKYKQWQESRTA